MRRTRRRRRIRMLSTRLRIRASSRKPIAGGCVHQTGIDSSNALPRYFGANIPGKKREPMNFMGGMYCLIRVFQTRDACIATAKTGRYRVTGWLWSQECRFTSKNCKTKRRTDIRALFCHSRRKVKYIFLFESLFIGAATNIVQNKRLLSQEQCLVSTKVLSKFD